MIFPNLREELRLYEKGYRLIAGIDEAGRGPLAGPVVAAAVIIAAAALKSRDQKLKDIFSEIRDSKMLSPRKREEIYRWLTNSPYIDWAVGMASEKIVDKINILQASLLAMRRAVEKLKSRPDFLLIDGRFTIRDYPIDQKAISNGDEKVFSVATASIVAKVTRDRLMFRYHKQFPQYQFDRHKGYGTKLHMEFLRQFGPCRIHRRSFRPVKNEIWED